jgi:hypothetical protein
MRGIDPTAVPLPITKTDFDTNTLPAWVITAAGGPVASIDVKLAAEAGSIMVKEQNPKRNATCHEKAVPPVMKDSKATSVHF